MNYVRTIPQSLALQPQAEVCRLAPGLWLIMGGTASSAVPAAEARPLTAHTPPELRLRIISYLAHNDLALAGRLSCREAAQRFSEPHHRTAQLIQPLPGHVVDTAWCLEVAQAAMKQLNLRQKLHMLSTAAASGCEANVEFAWQLLQPHVFPELLRTDHYQPYVLQPYASERWPDLGSAAVVSGLARLLPLLAQRCPGLLDPVRTLEAAARQCDLAGLQTAWRLLVQWLQSCIQEKFVTAQSAWRRVLCAAAGSPTPDALAKMGWALQKGRAYCRLAFLTVLHSDVCGAAAASGDLARLAWLRDRGFPWGTVGALAVVVRHADLPFVQRLEQEGGYLPPAVDREAWASEEVVAAAAGSTRDGVGKLQWLAGRGADLGSREALYAAAARGNLEAVQLLAGQPGQGPAGGGYEAALPFSILNPAIMSGSLPVAAWLWQAGYPWGDSCFEEAFRQGDLPMVRWLLQAGCPPGEQCILNVVRAWPCLRPADSSQLVEAVQLLAAAGWPATGPEAHGEPLLTVEAAVRADHPLSVLRALLDLHSADVRDLHLDAAVCAVRTGCEATLHALVGAGVLQAHRGNQVALRYGTQVYDCDLAHAWYACAAAAGDRGTLACLRQLGVPLQSGVLAGAVRQAAPPPALSWLVEQGVRWRRAEVLEALADLQAANRHVEGRRRVQQQEVEAWLQGRTARWRRWWGWACCRGKGPGWRGSAT